MAIDMDFRANPLQGALAGMQIADMTQTADRKYRDDDQAYLSKVHELDMAKAEDPAKTAEFKKRELTANEDSDIINSGLSKQTKIAKDQGVIADSQITQEKAKADKMVNTGTFLNQLSNELKASPMGSPQDGASIARWQDIQKRASEHGLTLPAAWDPNTIDMIHQKAQSFVDNLPTIRAKQAETAKAADEYKKAMDVAKVGADSREAVARVNKEKAEAVQAAKTANDQKMNNVEQMLTTQIAAADKAGKQLPKEMYLTLAQIQAEKQLDKDEEYKILQLQGASNPDAKKKADAIRLSKIAEIVKGLPGSEKAFAQSDLDRIAGGSTAPGAGGKAKKADLATRVGKAGESVDTEDGTFEWDNTRHGWKRKK